MCQKLSQEEIEECCEDPEFCAVCLSNGKNVIDHVCEDCQRG